MNGTFVMVEFLSAFAQFKVDRPSFQVIRLMVLEQFYSILIDMMGFDRIPVRWLTIRKIVGNG